MRDDRAQVGDALLGSADKRGAADGPEKPKARTGGFAQVCLCYILTRRQLEEGADAQRSAG